LKRIHFASARDSLKAIVKILLAHVRLVDISNTDPVQMGVSNFVRPRSTSGTRPLKCGAAPRSLTLPRLDF
jgi:hypothetical protein